MTCHNESQLAYGPKSSLMERTASCPEDADFSARASLMVGRTRLLLKVVARFEYKTQLVENISRYSSALLKTLIVYIKTCLEDIKLSKFRILFENMMFQF